MVSEYFDRQAEAAFVSRAAYIRSLLIRQFHVSEQKGRA